VWHRVLAGLVIVVTVYWGYQVISSALGAAPPPVAPVPARLATEAGLTTKAVAETTVQRAARISREAAPAAAKQDPPPAMVAAMDPRAQRSREPALMPSATYAPPVAVAPVAEPSRVSREPALNPSNDASAAQLEPAAINPEPAFRAPLPLGERYGEQNRNSRVTLRVHRPTRVAVLGARHHVWINRILRAGDTYRVPNLRGLTLSASDAGAVEVILDDNTVGFAGTDGAPAKGLPLQPQSIISRYHWVRD
jgi:cytoskeleton protein RodZ